MPDSDPLFSPRNPESCRACFQPELHKVQYLLRRPTPSNDIAQQAVASVDPAALAQ